MATFLDKKEQVYDFKLTSYGKYLLSIGKLKPAYYAFFDDNVIYDPQYFLNSVNSYEGQNHINKRIKEETSYLESVIIFEDLDSATDSEDYYEADVTARQEQPKGDAFKFYASIGDAYLDGETQKAPAWKIVSLQNDITSSASRDNVNTNLIPQVNIVANYRKKIIPGATNFNPNQIEDLFIATSFFADGNQIKLVLNDVMVYADEVNTQLLTENFEVEVFDLIDDSVLTHASASIRLLSNPTAGTDYIKIHDSTHAVQFDFVSSSPSNNQVKVGSTSLDSLVNLVEAIGDSSLNTAVTSFSLGLYPELHLRNDYAGLAGNDPSEGGAALIETNSPTRINISDLFNGGLDAVQSLKRKLFVKEEPQIVDGFMIAAAPIDINPPTITTGSVEYYFDLISDQEIVAETACKAAREFNKESYYIDLDFDCEQVEQDAATYYDIYGKVTEPDICQD
jgi:hypothetical protein